MADWKMLYEKFGELSENLKAKLRRSFEKKTREKLEELFAKEPYARRIYENLVSVKPTVTPTEKPIEKPTAIPPRTGEEIKTGPRFKSGDKVIYRWTGEEYTIKAVSSWPSVLVEDKYGHLVAKDEFQLLTMEEYATVKEQEKKIAEENKAARVPKLPSEPRAPREREFLLRDVFYAALSHAGVPIKEGYRARWRLELPKIVAVGGTMEEMQHKAEDFAQSIITEYGQEAKFRRGAREARPPLERATPFEPLVPGLQPEVREEGIEMQLQELVERRCPSKDHEEEAWKKANPQWAAEFPDGLFYADLNEERAAFSLPVPGYFRNRRFNGYCPYHRHTLFGAYITTVGKYVEVYMWAYKVSGARLGMDPGVVKAGGLDPEKYEHPVTWHPPGAVFDYWKSIGWRFPAKIEESWEKETSPLSPEEEKIPFWQRKNWWKQL